MCGCSPPTSAAPSASSPTSPACAAPLSDRSPSRPPTPSTSWRAQRSSSCCCHLPPPWLAAPPQCGRSPTRKPPRWPPASPSAPPGLASRSRRSPRTAAWSQSSRTPPAAPAPGSCCSEGILSTGGLPLGCPGSSDAVAGASLLSPPDPPWSLLGLSQVPPDLEATVVTIGMFDGVHRGHRVLLDRVVEEAATRGLPPAAITFDRHPMEVLRVSAEEFAEQVLFVAMRARAVVVGANFRFGHKATGDLALLAELGQPRGVEVIGIPLQVLDSSGGPVGEAVSSTRVRAALTDGDVEHAARLLGRPYTLEGHVVTGHRRGRLLGMPTANLAVPARIAVPAIGVYAGHLTAGGLKGLPAVTSVGVRPQFGGTELSVETYVIDFEGDLYGRRVTVSFEYRLRGEGTFPSVADLVAQMQEDVRQARHLLGMTGR